jgi:hypothetical protein
MEAISSQLQEFIYWKIPLGVGGEYQLMSFRGKNMKRGREKEEKCKRNRKKGKEKRKRRCKKVK